MDLKMEVYSPGLELLGILEGFRSLVYEEKAFSAGSFTLDSLITGDILELLQPENILWFRDQSAGIVEMVQQQESREGPYITVKGRMLTGVLERRILWGRYDLSGTASSIMRRLVEDSAVTPSRGEGELRKIPGLCLEEEKPDSSPRIRVQKTGGTLLEAQEELGEANAVAFGVGFAPQVPAMEFWTRPGRDRTAGQTENDPVFFSTELDDVLAAEYSYNSANCRNVALVAGEGEGADRTYLTVEGNAAPPEASGLDRRELWVDARDLQRGEEGSEDRLTPEEYTEVLRARGGEKLAENQLVQSFQATVRTVNPTYQLGRDFDLGDKITVEDKRLGVRADAVVTAVKYGISREGESQELTLGYSQPTIYEKLMRKADK